MFLNTDGYHFKSLEKIINDQQDENLEVFYFSNSLDIKNGIKDTRRLNEANVLELSSKDTFQCFYEKITPNYV